ncbi:Replication-associated recombination protein A [Usitatibacter rugosus]|uniref:Replication-associated recombination protein A n=1 Tax=Usitatibacter rugosus TaxID=2732067 RepID=A0A6M4GXC5_9PROT|nr:replication-associated recombination protein A [Usitatibacter rugosus]QJR11518.1 Replication-associated recombination protein A [Usitatibacter rugosus]
MERDLFNESGQAYVPLPERLRPQRLEDVVGQRHLLGEGKPLWIALRSGRPHSMILWGPPGVGKTTLARLMANAFNSEFIAISAVLSGVKEIREAVERARLTREQYGRSTILFVDEVHRFNKAQQDAFLPHVESGLLTFIGATTENPSFEVIGALLSRAQVYVLESLKPEDLDELIQRGFDSEKVDVTEEAKKRIAEFADGDGRRALNLVEQIAQAARLEGRHGADVDYVNTVAQRAGRRFDKGGENYYDQISALHKSMRGSDPDAALYWLVRMLDGGVDPRYLARRMIRMATEDVGLADPRALEVAINAAEVYERLGSPEGELALAECIVYLAIAAKSNAVYTAYNEVKAFISKDGTRPVPMHIRNAPTKLMKNLGYGDNYRYAHSEEDGYAAGENYFPEGMERPNWYRPTDRGLEGKIREKLEYLRSLDEQARKKGK